MALSLNYRFLLMVTAVAALISALLNMIASNVVWYGYELIPLWGRKSVTSYLYSTSIITSFILVWLVTKSTRYALRSKQILPLHWHLKSQTLIDSLPSRAVPRSFILAIASCFLTGFTLFLLDLREFYSFYSSEFFAFSTVYYILQSAAIAVMAIYRAMGDNVMHHAKVA
ncbi:hypothetical protein ACFSRY_17800 [Pontibacter locisalis]|uniref:Uncharacterized protein n=1 Tax=Pontibacter locisalis TaxID=1719035 RepID=A0ABW5IQS1_9BACT